MSTDDVCACFDQQDSLFAGVKHHLLYHVLWELGRELPEQPNGDGQGYVPPGHGLTLYLQSAVDVLTRAKHEAEKALPSSSRRHLFVEAKRGGIRWEDEAKKSPEVRRYYEIDAVLTMIQIVLERLQNEGRPRPPALLKLAKMRTSS